MSARREFLLTELPISKSGEKEKLGKMVVVDVNRSRPFLEFGSLTHQHLR